MRGAVILLLACVFCPRSLDAQATVRQVIKSIAVPGDAPQPRTEYERRLERRDSAGGIWECRYTDVSADRHPTEALLLNPNPVVVWPGAMVQYRGLSQGTPTLISLNRAPMRVFMTPDTSGAAAVERPDAASYQQTYQRILAANRAARPVSAVFVHRRADSFEEAMLDLEINVSWLTGRVKAALASRSAGTRSSEFIKFVQPFYSVGVLPPAHPEEWFAPDVLGFDLAAVAAEGNPPGYVASVTYGRMLLLRVDSRTTADSLRAAIDFAYRGEASVNARARAAYRRILSQSTYSGLVVGGGSTALEIILPGNQESTFATSRLLPLLRDDVEFSRENPGVPLAYTVRYLKDNSLAAAKYTTEFTIPNCDWKEEWLRVDSEGIFIHATCDGSDPGEFYWNIRVGGTDVTGRRRSHAYTGGGGFGIPINESYVVTRRARPLQAFAVRADVHERDLGGDDHMGPSSKTHRFEDGWSAGRRHQIPLGSGGCQAALNYRVSRPN